jgi:hypothetical protein
MRRMRTLRHMRSKIRRARNGFIKIIYKLNSSFVLLAIICLCLALFPLNKGPYTTETCFLKIVAILCILCNIHSIICVQSY